MEVENTQGNTIHLNAMYSINKKLTYGESEYTLGEISQQKAFDNKMYISFTFYRTVPFHVVSSYLPTFLLHWISYGTMFIRYDNFQDRGSMSLTTLLVLISLYSETITLLPVTSYIKFIKIWYLFSISYLSGIIAVHLITNDITITKVAKLGFSPHLQFFSSLPHFFETMKILFGCILLGFYALYWLALVI